MLLILTDIGSKWIPIIISGGFALVNENKVTILVNEAEFGYLSFNN